MSLGQDGQLDLPLTDPVRWLPANACLWLVAAKSGDASQIRDHLLIASSDEREAFFVRESDGTPALTPSSVVGIHDKGVLSLFAPSSFTGLDIPKLVHRALLARSAKHSPPVGLVDLLLIRLWGNGQATSEGSHAYGALGRGLARLQTSDLAANPFIFRSIAENLAKDLDPGAAGLRALLRRNVAVACLEAANRLASVENGTLLEAVDGLKKAALDFAAAGLRRHADRCDADADRLQRHLRTIDGTEPLLPGMLNSAYERPAIPRSAFRSYRCLGASLTLALSTDPAPGPAAHEGPREPSSQLIYAGALPVRGLRLEEVLSPPRQAALLPRARAVARRDRDQRQRIRVWLDEEHKALLNLPIGKPRDDVGTNFIISVTVSGRPLDPPFREIRQGRPADFFATARRTPEEVTVHVAAQGRKGTYLVAVD